MRFILKYLLISLLLLDPVKSFSQIKSIGFPSIVNHSRSDYKAGTQNWGITQSDNGFMYFGNNDGIMEFDGTGWATYPVPNKSVVRSVLAVGDTIYAGAYEELGYLAPDANEKLIYHSLNHLVPDVNSGFDEIWNIYEDHGKIIFQSYYYIFILSEEKIKVIEPLSRFGMLHLTNDQYYIVDEDNGLMLLEDESLRLVSDHPVFFGSEIKGILTLYNGDLLIGTSNSGLFRLNQVDGSIIPWDTDVNTQINQYNLFSAFELSDGYLAFGSVSNGIYISNQNGHIIQHINRVKGLQNNTILSLYADRKNNLWLGLDNGIDYIEISSPLTFLNYNFDIEIAYTSIVHNGILYVGTNQGLFAREFYGLDNAHSDIEGFRLLDGTEGQVWSLEVIDNTLFCGHNFGCFVIDGFTARQLSDVRGFWSFLVPPGSGDIILAGTYSGLVSLAKNNGQWDFDNEVKGFSESSRSMFMDNNENLWISHGYRGLFKLNLNSSLDSVIHYKLFKSESGLPEQLPYNIQVINSEMCFSTQEGILMYDNTNDTFRQSVYLENIFEGKGFIDKIHQDQNGNLWYFAGDYLGVMRLLEDGNYIDIVSPFSIVNEVLMPAFQNIYVYDRDNVFIGSQNGLIHYAPNITKDYQINEKVFIKEATFYGKNEELTSRVARNIPDILKARTRTIPYSRNSVRLRFTTPAFERPEKIHFSYRLIGFDDIWSDWEGVNFKEYTNLREGDYTFQVKALNAYNSVSDTESFSFTINPPVLRSKGAYIAYSFLLGLILAGNFYLIRRRIIRTRIREKIKHEKRLAQREKLFNEQTALSENEIMLLRNNALKNEMKFKNKELANATLNLIQKNRALTYMKDDLDNILKSAPVNESAREKINNLLKKINKDLRNEKNWELFNNYFDEVHQDFITRIKDNYQDLSPKELRLCAYLRMNISTKEIAPLMNISVRGVEISRYRLRKKLNLDSQVNLTEFIMNY